MDRRADSGADPGTQGRGSRFWETPRRGVEEPLQVQQRGDNAGQRLDKPQVHTTIQHISQVNRTRSDELGVRKVTDRYLIDDKGGRS